MLTWWHVGYFLSWEVCRELSGGLLEALYLIHRLLDIFKLRNKQHLFSIHNAKLIRGCFAWFFCASLIRSFVMRFASRGLNVFHGYYRGPSGHCRFFSFLSHLEMHSFLLSTKGLYIWTFIGKENTLNNELNDHTYYSTLHALLLTGNGNRQNKSHETDQFRHFFAIVTETNFQLTTSFCFCSGLCSTVCVFWRAS